MSLSDEERKLLEQMEAALAAEDPRLANTLRGNASNRRLRRRRAALAGLGFVIGAGLLVAGMQTHWVVSILGFLAMLGATVVALTSFEKIDGPTPKPDTPPATRTPGGGQGTPFMDKMEERWKRRQDEGL
ncbi:DUF3040 domain-containing protein [Mariniluteicoccus flavus]